ncbi:MAG TPA: ASPIC/UnbV domain-containing protein, partial [Chromatiaceae bacterium]|nr:ASPIC/UnbV domain-containing protein [Chromatiaceae bacterium]
DLFPARGYLSSVELPLTYGLGSADGVETLRVRWPDGGEQALTPVGVDRLIIVEQPGGATP